MICGYVFAPGCFLNDFIKIASPSIQEKVAAKSSIEKDDLAFFYYDRKQSDYWFLKEIT